MHKILSHLKFQTCIKKMEIKARPRLDYRGKLILAPMVKVSLDMLRGGGGGYSG